MIVGEGLVAENKKIPKNKQPRNQRVCVAVADLEMGFCAQGTPKGFTGWLLIFINYR